MGAIRSSELILSDNGRLYHLDLRPEDVSDLVLTVGDPHRVAKISRYFDEIYLCREKREFVTHTGRIGSRTLTVMSTGMGASNMDIWMNEMDALLHIDLDTRMIKSTSAQYTFIRLGTSGSLHPDIRPGDIVLNTSAIGLDMVMPYYGATNYQPFDAFLESVNHQVVPHYLAKSATIDHIEWMPSIKKGVSLTAPGFYGPQNRTLRLPYTIALPLEQVHHFTIDSYPITNMEMETAPLYYLGDRLGHRAYSLNCILANRLSGDFAADPKALMETMIIQVMDMISCQKI